MTEKLYYHDPTLLQFEAGITRTKQDNGKFLTVLDKTAFYPTSGGQPHDTGKLNAVTVTNVVEEKNEILHISNESVGVTGDIIKGEIDLDRRRYFRQLHTAQHILSSVFSELFELKTISVHLGENYGAIELETTSMSDEQLTRTENLSNEYILQSLPIEIIFANEAEAAKLPLRKQTSREGTIRVIKIGEIDWSACGGTHCCNSSEVGLIKIVSLEKQRGQALVKFLAGTKAKEDYDKRFAATDLLSRQLTCSIDELKPRFNKLLEENKLYRLQLSELQNELLPLKIEAAAEQSESAGGICFVCTEIESFDAKLLNNFAAGLADKISGIALLQCQERLIIGVCDSVDMEAKELAAKFSENTNLKGGGSKSMAQLGGAAAGQLETYRDLLVKILSELKH